MSSGVWGRGIARVIMCVSECGNVRVYVLCVCVCVRVRAPCILRAPCIHVKRCVYVLLRMI